MSMIGFDIENENCVIVVAKRGGIDVLLNDESKSETPAVVSFGEKQRFLGSSGPRIPAIMRRLTSLFGKEPIRTLNRSECVARGCVLGCAMLSPTLRVQD